MVGGPQQHDSEVSPSYKGYILCRHKIHWGGCQHALCCCSGDNAADLIPDRAAPIEVQEPGRTEMQYYATCINARLQGDDVLHGVLPLQPTAAALIAACRDGILLW